MKTMYILKNCVIIGKIKIKEEATELEIDEAIKSIKKLNANLEVEING